MRIMRKICVLITSISILSGCTYSAPEESQTTLNDSIHVSTTQALLPTSTAIPIFDPTPTLSPTFEPTPTLSPIEKLTRYNEGQYKIGSDIPAGEYVILSSDGYSGYFCVSSDANGNDILFNDNFEINSIITVKKGEYLELSQCIAFPSKEFYKDNTINLDNFGTMLKVGYDIPAGEYKLRTNGSDGYYCIYPNSRHNDIIANDNFKNSSYVNVKKGQYLVLNDCIIEQ